MDKYINQHLKSRIGVKRKLTESMSMPLDLDSMEERALNEISEITHKYSWLAPTQHRLRMFLLQYHLKGLQDEEFNPESLK